jgi:hypothetical protein
VSCRWNKGFHADSIAKRVREANARATVPQPYRTFTLKNRCAAFIGQTHAASIRFVLPITVYTRTSPLMLRLGVHVTSGNSLDHAIMVQRKKILIDDY